MYAVRRENLRGIASDMGSKAELARRLDMKPAQLNNIIGPHPTHTIGEKLARRIEAALGLPEGSIDVKDMDKTLDEVLQELETVTVELIKRAETHQDELAVKTAASLLREVALKKTA